MLEAQTILKVAGLRTYFRADGRVVKSVDGVDFSIQRGQTLAIVGESGSGKSVTSLSIMRLIAGPSGWIEGGHIWFRDRHDAVHDLAQLDTARMRKIRGREIAMIFQEPMSSLNPVYTIGEQIAESLMLHEGKTRKEGLADAKQLLELVEIPAAARRVSEYPHQMSGGMRQRAMIALALACKPALLIADEPTTALDVTIQAQILDLLRKLQKDLGMSMLFITHNLGVVAEIAQEIAVMYAGRVVEQASVSQLFSAPRHPYTQALIRCIPRIDAAAQAQYQIPGFRLPSIRGVVPHASAMPAGCAFAPRCDMAMADCELQMPSLEAVQPGQASRCIRWRELEGLAA
jgi:oligopeptide/dipeptide ABC transporter ATP-binding protein